MSFKANLVIGLCLQKKKKKRTFAFNILLLPLLKLSIKKAPLMKNKNVRRETTVE